MHVGFDDSHAGRQATQRLQPHPLMFMVGIGTFDWAIDKVVLKGRRQGKLREVIGLNHASATIVDGLGLYHKEDASDQEFAH